MYTDVSRRKISNNEDLTRMPVWWQENQVKNFNYSKRYKIPDLSVTLQKR